MDELKPSYKTGELLLYILTGIAIVYLESKGISVDDLTQKGAVFITKITSDPILGKFVLLALAVGFGSNRSSLKKKRLELQKDIEIEKIKQGIHMQ